MNGWVCDDCKQWTATEDEPCKCDAESLDWQVPPSTAALQKQLADCRAACRTSYGHLADLDLHVGDVIDDDDVKLWQAHVEAIQDALRKAGGL